MVTEESETQVRCCLVRPHENSAAKPHQGSSPVQCPHGTHCLPLSVSDRSHLAFLVSLLSHSPPWIPQIFSDATGANSWGNWEWGLDGL